MRTQVCLESMRRRGVYGSQPENTLKERNQPQKNLLSDINIYKNVHDETKYHPLSQQDMV